MKRAYSEYVFNKDFKKLTGMKNSELSAFLNHTVKTGALPEKDVMFVYNLVRIEDSVRQGHCMHYFFTGEGMHGWLKDCSAAFTNEHAAVINDIPITGLPVVDRDSHGNASGEGTCKVFMLHFAGGDSPCYLCAAMTGKDGWWACYIHQSKGSSVYFTANPNDAAKLEPESFTMMGTVASALSYIKCFPDTVVPGVPTDVKHPNHYKKCQAKSVGMHHSLIVRDGPSPHYRTYHVRYLESERFTVKRFTTVFVKGTFVKGKAKTVLSPEDSGKDAVVLGD
jgi:hypothetical protein